MAHQKIQVRGYTANLFSFVISTVTKKGLYTALHQRRGQAPSTGSFSDRFLNNSPAISAAQNAHSQPIIFEITEATRTPLDQLHFTVKTGSTPKTGQTPLMEGLPGILSISIHFSNTKRPLAVVFKGRKPYAHRWINFIFRNPSTMVRASAFTCPSCLNAEELLPLFRLQHHSANS